MKRSPKVWFGIDRIFEEDLYKIAKNRDTAKLEQKNSDKPKIGKIRWR